MGKFSGVRENNGANSVDFGHIFELRIIIPPWGFKVVTFLGGFSAWGFLLRKFLSCSSVVAIL